MFLEQSSRCDELQNNLRQLLAQIHLRNDRVSKLTKAFLAYIQSYAKRAWINKQEQSYGSDKISLASFAQIPSKSKLLMFYGRI